MRRGTRVVICPRSFIADRPIYLAILPAGPNRQISYINRYGHILRQPEIRTRQDKLQRFLEAHSEVATQTPMQIYCAFADSLPVIHAYRALCLTAGQYKQMASAKRIVAKGAYKKSLATCIANEIAFGYWRGVRSRLHLAPPLPLDFTLSLHGDKQIALAVALYSWRAGDKIYLFTVYSRNPTNYGFGSADSPGQPKYPLFLVHGYSPLMPTSRISSFLS